MPAKDITLLFVRLPTAEKRRIKVLAASQGLTLQQAVHEAFEAWASKLQQEGAPPPGPLPGALAGAALEKPRRQADADLEKPKPQARAAQPTQDARPVADAKPVSTSTGGQAPRPEGIMVAWLRQAAALDWSKCSAAESVPGEAGSVWVVRGTRAPLAAILKSLAQGYPFGEILEVFGLTLQQLTAVLQFAAEGFVLPPSAG